MIATTFLTSCQGVVGNLLGLRPDVADHPRADEYEPLNVTDDGYFAGYFDDERGGPRLSLRVGVASQYMLDRCAENGGVAVYAGWRPVFAVSGSWGDPPGAEVYWHHADRSWPWEPFAIEHDTVYWRRRPEPRRRRARTTTR